MSTLFDNIAKEILVDTYLSARINVAEIKKLLLDTYQLEEINNIYSVDYVPVIYLAFINEDIAEFFLFSIDTEIEDYRSNVLNKLDLIDIPNERIKKVMLTEYAITVVLYLELEIQIPVAYKKILLEVLRVIIETSLLSEELNGITIEINKAYKVLADRLVDSLF